MLGRVPKLAFSLMAASADLASGKGRFASRSCRYRTVGQQLPRRKTNASKNDDCERG